MTTRSQRYLAAYAGLLTLAFAAVVLTGAAESRKATFEEIDVQRINVREPDGTLRLLISNRDRFPDTVEMDGETRRHERNYAGLLFHNDEGIENGGLVFAGEKNAEDEISGFVHLSMDQYKQDQVVALNQIEGNGRRSAGLTVSDRPDRSIMQVMKEVEAMQKLPEAERKALMQQHQDTGEYFAERLFAGKTGAREAVLQLGDASGKPRIRLKVEPEGAASIEFLDEEGKVSHRLTPDSLAKAKAE